MGKDCCTSRCQLCAFRFLGCDGYASESDCVEGHKSFKTWGYVKSSYESHEHRQLRQYRALGTIEELTELVKAKQDGRLVELPCKVGDTVRATVNRPYNGNDAIIYGTVTDAQTVIRVSHSGCRHIDFIASDFGKTVFRTLEE